MMASMVEVRFLAVSAAVMSGLMCANLGRFNGFRKQDQVPNPLGRHRYIRILPPMLGTRMRHLSIGQRTRIPGLRLRMGSPVDSRTT